MNLSLPLDALIAFTLVLFRVGGLIYAMPVLGGKGMPQRAKLALAFFTTLLLLPVLPPEGLRGEVAGFWPLLGLVIHESLLGVVLGLLAQLPIWAAQLAGQLIGLQMGLGIASVLDPESGDQESLPASFLRNCALILFLGIGGHHILLESLAASFSQVPPGAVVLGPRLLDSGIGLSALVLTIGLKLGAPVMAALLLTEAGLGLVARTVPQMNIFIVGFPLKIALGLGLMAVSLPIFAIVFKDSFALVQGELEQLIGFFAP